MSALERAIPRSFPKLKVVCMCSCQSELLLGASPLLGMTAAVCPATICWSSPRLDSNTLLVLTSGCSEQAYFSLEGCCAHSPIMVSRGMSQVLYCMNGGH